MLQFDWKDNILEVTPVIFTSQQTYLIHCVSPFHIKIHIRRKSSSFLLLIRRLSVNLMSSVDCVT